MDSEETSTRKKQKGECIINFLPDDLIEWIFLRLPVSTLLRCIEVCKQWHKVIRDPQFITAHLKQAPRCALVFVPQESVSGQPYPSDAIIFDEAWSQSKFSVPVIGPDDFLCGSCNGLVCLYTKRSTIKIANLATGEWLLIDKPTKVKGDHFSFYRFAFHPVTKEYKVTHFLGNYSQGTFNVIQIYTLGSDKWKNVKSSKALSLSCVKNSAVVSVDGSMFWLTEDAEAIWKHAVISFDLSEETFAWIQLPEVALGGYRRYWITEIGGKVCVATAEVYKHRPKMLADKLQMWMLDSKSEQSWSPTYSLPYAYNYLPAPHFVHGDKIMMQNFFCDLYLYELFGDNCGTELSKRVALLNFGPHKPDNVQSYIFVKSLVRLDSYKKAAVVHGSKQREGWELKKWEAWQREISQVENTWKKLYQLEQSALVAPRSLALLVEELLQNLPDEVIRQQITMQIDQILQRLPDCPDQHPRSLRRLNWVEWKKDSKRLSIRVDRVNDITKAYRDIIGVLSDVPNHLKALKQAYDCIRRMLSKLQNCFQRFSSSKADISSE